MYTLIKIDKTEIVEHTRVPAEKQAEEWVMNNLAQDPMWTFTKEFIGGELVYKLEKHHD